MSDRDDTVIVPQPSPSPRAGADQQPDAIESIDRPAEPVGRDERRGVRRLWGLLYRNVRRHAQLLDELVTHVRQQDQHITALVQRTDTLATKVDMLTTKVEILERR